jgi:hypothetical protein
VSRLVRLRDRTPCGLFEHGKVHFRGIDPCLIGGDRRGDPIPFAAQDKGDVHLVMLGQNKNIVNANSKLPELPLLPNYKKSFSKGTIFASPH